MGKQNESFFSVSSEENESFFTAFSEFENEYDMKSQIEEEIVEERIDLQQLVGDWKRTASAEAQKQYQKMVNDVLNTEDINKKLGFIKKNAGELAQKMAGRLVLTINIRKHGDFLKVRPSYIEFPKDFPAHRMVSYLVSSFAKTQTPEVWSSDPSEITVATVNGPTERVCGLKYTSRGVEFGFLQCVDNLKDETCKQFVEMKYSLKENNRLEQNFTVYYLNQSVADVFKKGEECPIIEKSLYKSKESFILECSKQ